VLSILQAAGWPVWFLILASFLAVALIIERALSLRRSQVLPARLLEQTLEQYRGRTLDAGMVQKLEGDSPLGQVLAAGLRHAGGGRDVMKDAMEERGQAVAHELERFLPALGTLSTVTPLMGLFGTVVGMIEIFGAAAPTGNNPQALAHGISVALYNTALGLMVAIPALIAYRLFRTRVDGFLVDLEQQAIRLLDAVHPRPGTAAATGRLRSPEPATGPRA
jgi:biopolymer transport protein ExbB